MIAGIAAGAVRKVAELVITLSAAERRQPLDCIIGPYSFFKHADYNPVATLAENDIDPDGVIGHAQTALTMISAGKPLPDTIKPYLERHDPLGAARSPDRARPEQVMRKRRGSQVSGLGGRGRYKPFVLIR